MIRRVPDRYSRFMSTFQGWKWKATRFHGMTRQEAYQAWRRGWWEATNRQSWKARREGIKRRKGHYRDCTTAREDSAT